MYSHAELEDILRNQLNVISESGNGWQHVEFADTRNLDIKSLPLVLIGSGSVLAQPFVSHALAHFNVVGLVDNMRVGQTTGGLPILGDAGLRDLRMQEPDLVGIMCCNSNVAVDHFLQIWSEGPERPILSLFQALRRTPLEMSKEFSNPGTLKELLEKESVLKFYKDDFSRKTFMSLLLHRLSWDRRWLDPVRQPYSNLYFFSDALSVGDDEVLIDGGAYDGDTALAFSQKTNGKYRHIHCFEADSEIVPRLHQRVAGLHRITVHPIGLWSENTTLRLSPNGIASSINPSGTIEVPVQALDSMGLGGVSFIKLDIEGSEIPMLQGAAETIREYKPKLAISVYHKPDDLISIPELIQSIRPDYTFRLRHHTPIFHDSVLYAE